MLGRSSGKGTSDWQQTVLLSGDWDTFSFMAVGCGWNFIALKMGVSENGVYPQL